MLPWNEEGGCLCRWQAGLQITRARILSNNNGLLSPLPAPQLESYIEMNMKSEMAWIQQNVVQNQTATMREIGTSLLNQTAEQARKLTVVEAQVQWAHSGKRPIT